MNAAGIVITAGAIAAANEAVFIPMENHTGFNWSQDSALFRLIPATAVLALTLTGLEKVSEPLGKGLAGLVLLAVLILPMGKAPSPLENAGKVFGGK
jgi:hypothetical protein